MSSARRLLIALLLALPALPTAMSAPPAGAPPPAPARPVTETLYGVRMVDPYRWMEAPSSNELASWMKAQGDHTRRILEGLPGRAALVARVRELDSEDDRVGAVQVWGERTFYFKRGASDNLAKLYVRERLDGPERLLVDPEALTAAIKDGKHVAIDFFYPSLDGKLVAYGISKSGSEETVLHVLDVTSGRDLPDVIDRLQFKGVSWLDDKHFCYTRLQKLAPNAPQTEKYKKATAYLHTLGQDAGRDPALLGSEVAASAPVRELEIAAVHAPVGSAYVFGIVSDGVLNEVTVYYAPRRALAGASTPWKKLFDADADKVVDFEAHGDDVYFLTHKGAPRFTVKRTSLAHPDPNHATVIVPEGREVLRRIGLARDALYSVTLDAGLGRLRRVPFSGGASELVATPEGSLAGLYTHPQREGAIVMAQGWTLSPRWLLVEAAGKRVRDTGLMPPSRVDLSSVMATETWATSRDGTKVPLSIIHQKGLAQDGERPTLLGGYGAYGIVQDPGFAPIRLAWLERGTVFAVCHVRGGGELGDDWHRNGMLLKKQHTIDDFIGCAQYLIDHKYTKPARLAGTGTSAGGILIGGAITQRPELFAAAVPRVGVLNAVRFENTVNVLNTPEFGTVKTEEGFRALYGADAYLHVKDGVSFPAMLLTTGMTDPRVAPWQVAKMAARLQAATTSGKPVLLRVEVDAGHGIGSTKDQADVEWADTVAFLLWQLGGNPAASPIKAER